MISLRYHAVSIAAVFLALAIGVVLGASGVSDRVLAAVSTQRDDLGAQVTRLTAERDALAARERAADEFASRVGPAAVRGLLAGQTVALVVAAPTCRPRRLTGSDRAGRRDGHRPGRADRRCRRPGPGGPAPRADLPAAARGRAAAGGVGHRQPGGGLLGGVLLARDGQPPVEPRRRRLRARPASPAPGSSAPGRPGRGEPRARAHRRGQDGVDAADAAASTRGSPPSSTSRARARCWPGAADRRTPRARSASRGRTRTSPARLSTVDDVQSGAGRVAAVLALHEQLDGRAGSYGTGTGAVDGAAPAVRRSGRRRRPGCRRRMGREAVR